VLVNLRSAQEHLLLLDGSWAITVTAAPPMAPLREQLSSTSTATESNDVTSAIEDVQQGTEIYIVERRFTDFSTAYSRPSPVIHVIRKQAFNRAS